MTTTTGAAPRLTTTSRRNAGTLAPSLTQVRTVRSILRNKATWNMTAEELARVIADHQGWASSEGGWIYGRSGRPIVQGWTGLARRLQDARVIIPGTGIDWTRLPQGADIPASARRPVR
jgi:hypothetical protein